jgi:alkanesulfonate monooxygenase SsuD/methylene tetrahydromethanopterin reductase-like flavin-dependent oxidoreductase (luciferase family)
VAPRWAAPASILAHTLEPFVALAPAAAATKTIKVGTAICLGAERDPITTVKEVASLDVLSNGRVLFGVGAGWNAEEMENHGTVFASRYRVMHERVLAMKEIWTKVSCVRLVAALVPQVR